MGLRSYIDIRFGRTLKIRDHTILNQRRSRYVRDKVTLQDQYEKGTGEKATYRKGHSDYHTLKYVRWLEHFASHQPDPPEPEIIKAALHFRKNWFNVEDEMARRNRLRL